MLPSSTDLPTVLAIWSLVAATGVGVAALPWSAAEVSESAAAWRALGSLGRRAVDALVHALRAPIAVR